MGRETAAISPAKRRLLESRLPKGKRARHILYYILAYKRDNGGNSPSVRQIAAVCDLNSTGATYYQLQRLVEGGHITLDGRVISVRGGRWSYVGPKVEGLLAEIVAYKTGHDGNGPSLEWLAGQSGRSIFSVRGELLELEAAGLIDRLPAGDNGKRGALKVQGGRWEYVGEGVRP